MNHHKLHPDTNIAGSLQRLQAYIEAEEFKGYDPYDTLNSFIPFAIFGKWPAAIATQIQKRNPLNIRPILGIKKDYNPKSMGLLLHAYVNMQDLFPDKEYSMQMGFLLNWLQENSSDKFSGPCWGYNFGWASPEKYLPPHAPTVVATAFVAQGIHRYYLHSKNEKAGELLCNIGSFIVKDVPVTTFPEGICFSYSPFMKDCCYNASLLAAETLSRIYSINKDESLKELAHRAVEFVISKQFEDGHWNYKIDADTGVERVQIDFHQGYIIDSIKSIMDHTDYHPTKWSDACQAGIEFYKSKQFFKNGRSLWRLPKEYPVEIHNQSQGIISFSRFGSSDNSLIDMADTIAQWTIQEMQDPKQGYFYYRKLKYYKNKISFMRWSNAWMFLALTELMLAKKKEGAAYA